ncbi:hypothetical protein PG994_007700 [Apiospora phragmitis]|uniref:Uncharacterized protein n=1 Tax=Apiospora phragmitis TaxID=2905665 RepID=A0ABR1UQY3_9PEZI
MYIKRPAAFSDSRTIPIRTAHQPPLSLSLFATDIDFETFIPINHTHSFNHLDTMEYSLALIATAVSLAAASSIGGLPGLPVDSVLNEAGKSVGPALGEADEQLGSTLDKVDEGQAIPLPPTVPLAPQVPRALSSPARALQGRWLWLKR